MGDWFRTPFMGSVIPITYTEQKEIIDNSTGIKVETTDTKIVGRVYTDDLLKLKEQMKKISEEATKR